MGLFFETVEALLERAIQKSGKSKSKLLGLTGITPSQWDRCIREKRIFSDTMIEAMGKSEYFDITEEELEALALIERKGQDKAAQIAAILEKVVTSPERVSKALEDWETIKQERKKK